MTGATRTDEAGFAVSPRRRVLLVSFGAESAETLSELAVHLDGAAEKAGIAALAIDAFISTGDYRADAQRRQEFTSASAAIQIDYDPTDEADVVQLMHGLDSGRSLANATTSAGHVVTCLEPLPETHLLLLGAQRRVDLSPEQFERHWADIHAPRAVRELRDAPVPIGYELFLVDHALTATMATKRHPAGAVDGWMHLRTRGLSDLASIIHDPEHAAWVLEDEANFVNFAAPLVGQHMRFTPAALTRPTPSTKKQERQS